MSSDVNWHIRDKLWPMLKQFFQYSFTSTETRRLVRTDSPGRPPRLSHSSSTMWYYYLNLEIKIQLCAIHYCHELWLSGSPSPFKQNVPYVCHGQWIPVLLVIYTFHFLLLSVMTFKACWVLNVVHEFFVTKFPLCLHEPVHGRLEACTRLHLALSITSAAMSDVSGLCVARVGWEGWRRGAGSGKLCMKIKVSDNEFNDFMQVISLSLSSSLSLTHTHARTRACTHAHASMQKDTAFFITSVLYPKIWLSK